LSVADVDLFALVLLGITTGGLIVAAYRYWKGTL